MASSGFFGKKEDVEFTNLMSTAQMEEKAAGVDAERREAEKKARAERTRVETNLAEAKLRAADSKEGEELENAFDSLQLLIQSISDSKSAQFFELINSQNIIKLSSLMDNYLKMQATISYGRFEFKSMRDKFQKLCDQFKENEIRRKIQDDQKEEFDWLVAMLNQQWSKIETVPETDEEKKFESMVQQLNRIADAFFKDLEEARKLGTSKPFFGFSSAWVRKHQEFQKKYMSNPYNLFLLIEAIKNEYTNIPMKIKSKLEPLLRGLFQSAADFKKRYVEKNCAVDDTTKNNLLVFFESILLYIPKTSLMRNQIEYLNKLNLPSVKNDGRVDHDAALKNDEEDGLYCGFD